MFEKAAPLAYISRRNFLQGCGAVLASSAVLGEKQLFAKTTGPAQRIFSLDQGWLFGGKLGSRSLEADFQDNALTPIALPHCVTPLSWQKWNPATWEDVWLYRRHFQIPKEAHALRLFLHFDRVMTGATPVLNGHPLTPHLGGFLPFEYEITDLVREGDNILSVAVDARWMDVPPAGSPKGPPAVDYLLPGGISGSVSLRAVPAIFLKDVFAKPVDVLSKERRLEVTCRIDSHKSLPASVRLTASLREADRGIAETSKSLTLERPDQEVSLTFHDLKDVNLWDVENPHLYDLVLTLDDNKEHIHSYRTRVGFREARFELDGFYLNGKRLQLFGLNRHELYPYVGFAASDRALRKDAEILRHQFNCNVVRCSHYPQSEAFLNACDELGLLVWEETPGWQYIGGKSFQDFVLRDVRDMVRRDRNHPSIVIWGVRVNESENDPDLYRRTRELAKSLDDTRPTSGSMTPDSKKNWQQEWHQDVFAFDDYHADSIGSVGILPPLPGVPYMLAEAVGQFNYETGKGFGLRYRRAGDPKQQMDQALFHAQAHNKAADYPRCAGVIAWCAFDYASLMNDYDGVKCPGVADVFRIPKLGASFYRSQVDPKVHPVIEPDFYWDFGVHTPAGPGARAAIFSNCDRLVLSIDGKQHSELHPDRNGFPHLKYPPSFADLRVDGRKKPELRIDGYLGEKLVVSRSFSSDPATDRLMLNVDDRELLADGSDTTRLWFAAVDQFGAPRPFIGGEVRLTISGPAVLVGDNPFQLTDSGGVGAVWVRTQAGRAGEIRVEANHPTLGHAVVTLQVKEISSSSVLP